MLWSLNHEVSCKKRKKRHSYFATPLVNSLVNEMIQRKPWLDKHLVNMLGWTSPQIHNLVLILGGKRRQQCRTTSARDHRVRLGNWWLVSLHKSHSQEVFPSRARTVIKHETRRVASHLGSLPISRWSELGHKEGWEPKNWCFWTAVLEKTLESPLDCKEIQPVHPKGKQSWIFIGKTGAEAPELWPPDAQSRFIRKDPDAGKDWSRKRRGPQRMRRLDGITDSMDMSLSKL